MNRNPSTIQILMIARIMYKLRNFIQSHLQVQVPNQTIKHKKEKHFPSTNYILEHSQKRTCLARFPNTNNIASITLLFPLPFGPTTAEKL